jgi:hypothetical protein
MPQVVTDQRKAVRTTVIKDEVPAPPLPDQAALPGMEPAPGEEFDAFSWMQRLKGSDWADYMVYLYWSPPGQRRLGPYIDVIAEAVTIEQIRKKFGGSGGGRFIIWVNHTSDPPWRKTTEFEIEGDRIFTGKSVAEANPVAPTQSNELLQVLKQLLEKQGNLPPDAQRTFEMQQKAFENTFDTISRKMSAAGTDNGVLDILKLFLPLLIKPAESGGGLLDTIRALKELGLIGAQNATDPLKMVDTVSKLIEATNSLRPDDGGGDFKSILAKGAIELVPTFRGMMSDYAKAAEWNARAAQNSQRVTPSASSQSPERQADSSQVPAPSSSSAPHSSPEAAPAPSAAGEWDIRPYLFDRVAFMLNGGFDGDQIAQWLYMADPETREFFKDFTEKGLLAFLSQFPLIEKALEGKNSLLLAQHFLYYCKTRELVEEDIADDVEPPVEPEPPAKE